MSVYPHRETTSAAILAGGQARRFAGRDKSRVVISGRSIIVRQLDVLQQVAAEIVVVSPFAERFADLSLAVHADRISGLGAIGGIYTAVEVANADNIVVVACDLPFLTAPLLGRLVELAQRADGAWIHSRRGVEPLVACYRKHSLRSIRNAIDAGRLTAGALADAMSIAELPESALTPFGDPERLLANINTAADLARLG